MATTADCRNAIETLALLHSKQLTKGDVDRMASLWQRVLEDVSVDDLRGAVQDHLSSATAYFPVPGRILELARARAQGYRPYEDPPKPEHPVTKAEFRTMLAAHGIDRRQYTGPWNGEERREPPQPQEE